MWILVIVFVCTSDKCPTTMHSIEFEAIGTCELAKEQIQKGVTVGRFSGKGLYIECFPKK